MLDWCFGTQLAFSKVTPLYIGMRTWSKSSEEAPEARSHVCSCSLICSRSSVWQACKPTPPSEGRGASLCEGFLHHCTHNVPDSQPLSA